MLNQVLQNQSRVSEGPGSREPERPEGRDVGPVGSLHFAERGVSATDVRNSSSRKRRRVDECASNDHDVHTAKTRDIGDEPFLKLFEDQAG